MFSRTHLLLAPVLFACSATAFAAGFDDCPQFFASKPPTISGFGQQRALCFEEFAILHSGQTKTPLYTAQRLNAKTLDHAKDLKRIDKFYEEARLPQAVRALLSDYRRSGLSRGHMAGAADMGTKFGKAQSYSLANMVPQDPTQNGKPWSQIEQEARRLDIHHVGTQHILGTSNQCSAFMPGRMLKKEKHAGVRNHCFGTK